MIKKYTWSKIIKEFSESKIIRFAAGAAGGKGGQFAPKNAIVTSGSVVGKLVESAGSTVGKKVKRKPINSPEKIKEIWNYIKDVIKESVEQTGDIKDKKDLDKEIEKIHKTLKDLLLYSDKPLKKDTVKSIFTTRIEIFGNTDELLSNMRIKHLYTEEEVKKNLIQYVKKIREFSDDPIKTKAKLLEVFKDYDFKNPATIKYDMSSSVGGGPFYSVGDKEVSFNVGCDLFEKKLPYNKLKPSYFILKERNPSLLKNKSVEEIAESFLIHEYAHHVWFNMSNKKRGSLQKQWKDFVSKTLVKKDILTKEDKTYRIISLVFDENKKDNILLEKLKVKSSDFIKLKKENPEMYKKVLKVCRNGNILLEEVHPFNYIKHLSENIRTINNIINNLPPGLGSVLEVGLKEGRKNLKKYNKTFQSYKKDLGLKTNKEVNDFLMKYHFCKAPFGFFRGELLDIRFKNSLPLEDRITYVLSSDTEWFAVQHELDRKLK